MENPEVQPNEPQKQNEGQNAQPAKPDTEINTGGPATNTEVDLDTQKNETYPDQDAPKRQ